MKASDLKAGQDYLVTDRTEWKRYYNTVERVRLTELTPSIWDHQLKAPRPPQDGDRWENRVARGTVLGRTVREDGKLGKVRIIETRHIRGEWAEANALRDAAHAADTAVRDAREVKSEADRKLRMAARDLSENHGVRIEASEWGGGTQVKVEAADLLAILRALPMGWKLPQ